MMQIYADVLNMEIKISASPQTPALGAAMFGAVAAGKGRDGYDSITEAAQDMAKLKDEVFRPQPEHVPVYDQLYREYATLYDYFGRGSNDVMKTLKRLKREASEQKVNEPC